MTTSAETTPRSANFEYERRNTREGMRGLIGAAALLFGLSDTRADHLQSRFDAWRTRNKAARAEKKAQARLADAWFLDDVFGDETEANTVKLHVATADQPDTRPRPYPRRQEVATEISAVEMPLPDDMADMALASIRSLRQLDDGREMPFTSHQADDRPTAEIILFPTGERVGRHAAEALRGPTQVMPQIREAA